MSSRATGTFTMGNYFKVAGTRHGDKEAVYCATTDRRFTFRQVNERMNGLGNGLLSLGVKKGEVTAFLSMNRAEIFETYGALAKIGSLGIPLNYRLAPAEIIELINFCDARNIIFDPAFADTVNSMREKTPGLKRFVCMGDTVPAFALSYDKLVAESSRCEPDVDVCEEDQQYLNLTSGTTGLPKAYLLTHYNNAGAGPLMALAHDVSPSDVVLTVFPIFGRVGFAWCSMAFFCGARNVIHQFDLAKMLELIGREKVTISNWVPTIASFVLSLPDLSPYDFSSLRALVFAASPFPPALQEQVKSRLCPNIYEYYGLQESGALVSMGPKDKERKPTSVGTLHPGADVRIVDAAGKDVPVGEVGEVIGRGVAVTTGYYKNPEKTSEMFRDGWFYTGDLGRFDEDGFLYLSGRKKDMIISGGQNIFAVEVEDTLTGHEAVMQCAVFGLPDQIWGEMVSAAVVKMPGKEVTAEELIAYGRERIAHFKVPKKIFFVDSLPMTPTGKVKKFMLVEQYSKG
ncbi:MAG TPA: AMP-binding protein [Spirochaetota bacterium]|nr:AMP-binding protein [Spirochaetota bacterium]